MPRRASGAAKSGHILAGLCGVSSSVPTKSTWIGFPADADAGREAVCARRAGEAGAGFRDCAKSDRPPIINTVTPTTEDHANVRSEPSNLMDTPFEPQI